MAWTAYTIQRALQDYSSTNGWVKRKRGRQKKKWTDHITEWTNKIFAETQEVAHNRELWTQLVQQSLTVADLRPRNGIVRRRCFGDGRFGDEMWNVFSFGMSPKCKSSHYRCEACRRKIRSTTCPNRTAMRAVYPNVHTLIKSKLITSCTTAFDWIAIALITLYHNVKVNYSKSI